MKKILCVLLVVLMCLMAAPLGGFADLDLGFTASALNATGKCGKNATYTFDSATGELVISGAGAIAAEAFYKNQEIKNVIIGDGITEIGTNAFNQTSIESISIANSITIIGNYVFSNCYNLTNINIPDSVITIGDSAFKNCDRLTIVDIPDSVTTIGDSAFYGCDILAGIDIGDSVNRIGTNTFGYCRKLASIDIPDSVNSIGDSAFYGCESLVSVVIGDNVNRIGNEAFGRCINLASVNIPNSVITIGNSAFYDCSKLLNVEIGDSVSTIGSDAFNNCCSLESVNIPKSVAYIGRQAFRYCSSLYDVYYAGSEVDWNAIEIGENNTALDNATIHFGEEYEIPTVCQHIWSSIWTASVASTCIVAGTRGYYACTVFGCDAKADATFNEITTIEKELDPNNHTTTKVIIKNQKDATCTDVGYTGDTYHKCCDALKMAGTVIPATGHDWNLSETKKEATCTEEGILIYKCIDCKETKEKTISATGHDYEAITDLKFETCTEDGAVEYVCYRCKDSYIETIPATGHSYPSTWSVLITPDCQNTGFAVKVCFGCHDVIAQVVPKAGHADNDGDSHCDTCNCEIVVMEPTDPETPDKPADEPVDEPEEPCDCNCHAGGLEAFFFKLTNFFAKIFSKDARTCKCGSAH